MEKDRQFDGLYGRSVEVFTTQRYPRPAPDKQACRSSDRICELHSASQSEVLITHTNKKKKRVTRTLFSFLVEVWRFELQASSTRTAIFAFFDYQTLHIARIFRKIVSFCTLVPFIPYRTFPVVVSYVVKLKIRLKAENGESGKAFSPHLQTVPVLRNIHAIYAWFDVL